MNISNQSIGENETEFTSWPQEVEVPQTVPVAVPVQEPKRELVPA